jgi:glycosyltransferase involved in cell wall biosynthesis
MPAISIVVPVYNERESLEHLAEEIYTSLKEAILSYEVIVVDDGSTDGSTEILAKLVQKYPGFRVITFRRNFGKSAALAAGFAHASGKILVTIDGDLQDPPSEIPRFLDALEGETDLVVGWKSPRQDPLSKTLPSRFFNRVVRWMSGVSIHDFNCGFKAFRHQVAKDVSLYGELHRYMPVFAARRGWRVTEIKVPHRPRLFGQSKYSFKRVLRGFFDFLTVSFITIYIHRPLHFIGGIGLFFFLTGIAIECYMSALWFLGYRPIGNRPLFFLGILNILVGVQFLTLGLLGEHMTHLLFKQDAVYDIKAKDGFKDSEI